MAIIKLSLDNFESLILNEYENDGYYPVSLEQLKEHELFQDLLKILKAVKPDFDVNNVFTLAVVNGYPSAVYGFSLVKKDGKALLQFGAGNQKNEVEVTCTIEQDEAGDDVAIYKVGNATLLFSVTNNNTVASFLKFGKNQVSIFTKWQKDVSFQDVENFQDIDDLVSCLDVLGVAGVKLTDLVRPYIKQGLNSLPKPIIADVLSWQITEPHPDYGTSVIFNIKGVPEALTAEGSVIKNPGAVYVNSNQISAIVIQKPDFCKKAIEAIQNGGKLQLVIPQMARKEPGKYMPNNLLKIVPGNGASVKALEPSKKVEVVKTVEVEVVKTVEMDEKELELLGTF